MAESKEPGALRQCNVRYGVKLFREMKLRLIGGEKNGEKQTRYLVWTPLFARYGQDVDGRKVVTPTATKSAFNHHSRCDLKGSVIWRASVKMKARDVYEHLLAGPEEIERMVAYTNACPVRGRHRVGLFMLDIDCHDGQPRSEAWATARLLDGVIDAPIYWEPSTSGTGLHGYVTLLWTRFVDHGRIRDDIKELEEALAKLTTHMAARCAEVKGTPMLLGPDRKSLLKMGSWAKLPRPQSKAEALRLMEAMDRAVSCQEAIQSACSALSSLRKKTATQPDPSPSARPSQEVLVEGQSSNCARPLSGRPERETGDDYTKTFYRGENTFERATEFVSWFMRKQYRAEGRLPSLEEAMDAYVQEGLATGNSDQRCVTEVYDKMVSTFNPELVGGRSITGWLPHATEVVETALRDHGKQADLQADFQSRVVASRLSGLTASTIESLRPLRRERLAKLLACLLWVLTKEENHMGGFGQKLAVDLMRDAFGLSLHQREFSAGMAWLIRNGVCELVSEAISTKNGTGRCRGYRLSSSATQTASPPA